jgi:hypothetical protein
MDKNKSTYNREHRQQINQKNQEAYKRRQDLTTEMKAWLAVQLDRMVLKKEFINRVDNESDSQSLLSNGSFFAFQMQGQTWVHCVEDHTPEFAKLLDDDAKRAKDELWKTCLNLSGNVIREDGSKGKSPRLMVIARTYTEESAARNLSISTSVIHEAIRQKKITSFRDPDGHIRIPAEFVEKALAREEILEQIAGLTPLRVRNISLVVGISYTSMRGRLKKANLSTTAPLWEEVRGKWGLPAS